MKTQQQSLSDVRWHDNSVSIEMRSKNMGQNGACVWFTGLSGSGKSTLANALDVQLVSMGMKTFLLDGDNLRHGLCSDLGMTESDRRENIRRAGEVAKLMADSGLIVPCAFISPYERDRALVRRLFSESRFLEVYVATDLQVCERRDPKGLYSKARQGLISNFTGIDSAYEPPLQPELKVDTNIQTVETVVSKLLQLLQLRA
ncbi:adenylyl-sulfate kinase [Aquipseudomonas alcaligenes]|uniref:Adenylyl-sulfate kinase n=1 Tax=Aquipseudomonas alcaligenes (strain ATCC 14909 / DSM 50342 / CCUG 1425 / JCM 20561 / NBRC 14159 / NCIMB 9945 / NCTC 10367 / 1577) TaxID=1215092 RepID=U3B3P3_AQUA1|nr:adenylyl-sulfate kinase [Pseudomonas alcaligenes]GAD64469.1 adenylyl-sulfate kinase [Pseudomonas alcaligenes NBRC 14159]SUD20537.1 adenylylsulfate kinase [Pseudomonas alcaligenes]